MRPGRRARGLRATARALLSVATALLLLGSGAAVLHDAGNAPVTVAVTTND